MYIARHNPLGGRKLTPKHFPLHEDKQGNLGFLIGYDKDGDKLLIPISLAEDIANQFADEIHKSRKLIKLTRREVVPLKIRMAKWLLGEKGYKEFVEREQED